MDNRSYDPEGAPKVPLTPDGGAEGAQTLGEHHEQPMPAVPLHGVTQTPADLGQSMAARGGTDAPRPGYDSGYDERATSTQPDQWPAPKIGAEPAAGTIPPESASIQAQSPYSPDAYSPGPGQPPYPAPPERGGGFNWLACCGIGCGVLLVIGVVAFYAVWHFAKPIISAGVELGKVADEVKRGNAPASAAAVKPEELGQHEEQYDNQWIAVSGRVADDPGPQIDKMRQNPSLQNSTAYYIKPNIVLLDVSTATATAHQGDIVSAIGKPVQMDFAKMLGPLATREMEKNNDMGDMKKIVFLICNGVKVVGHEDKDPNEKPATGVGSKDQDAGK